MRAVAAEVGTISPDASAVEPLCDDPVVGSLASEACNDIVNDSWWLEREPAEHGGLPALGADELHALADDALLQRFATFAVEYEGADGTPPYEDLYYQIDDTQREFERRGAPRALLALYTHADVRVRAVAAQWTMSTAPELARDRLAAIDDEAWSPPPADPPKKRTPKALAKLSAEELAERYIALSKERYAAMDNWEIARPNRLYGRILAIGEELERRDAQAALLPYLADHDNGVRLAAAWALRSIAPDRALAELKRTAALPFAPPLAVEARGMLSALSVDWTELIDESPYLDDTGMPIEPPSTLPLFIAAWQSEVLPRLATAFADPGPGRRYVALSVPLGYVQAIIPPEDEAIWLSAYSGFWAKPEGEPRTHFVGDETRATLGRLGFRSMTAPAISRAASSLGTRATSQTSRRCF
jgi:hypothetical protein